MPILLPSESVPWAAAVCELADKNAYAVRKGDRFWRQAAVGIFIRIPIALIIKWRGGGGNSFFIVAAFFDRPDFNATFRRQHAWGRLDCALGNIVAKVNRNHL